jgi:hypothetical protein
MPSLSRRSSESSVSSAGSGVTEAEFVIECDLSCLDRDTVEAAARQTQRERGLIKAPLVLRR